MSETYSEIYQRLSRKYPDVLTLDQLAELLLLPSLNALRISFQKRTLPVTIRLVASRQRAFLSDVAKYFATGEKQEQILPVRQKTPAKTKTNKCGRPSKSEQIARRTEEAAK
jgi:hypothetical protein